jgi:transketolase
MRIDGHDPTRSPKRPSSAQKSDKPTLIACKTVIGFGAPNKAGTSKAHGSPLGAEEIAGAREALGWDHPSRSRCRPTSSTPGALPAFAAQGARRLGKAPGRRRCEIRASSTAACAATCRQSRAGDQAYKKKLAEDRRPSPPARRQKWRSRSINPVVPETSAAPPT